MAIIENLLSQGIVERLGWMLIHFVWQAAAVALLLTVALRLLHRFSANARYITGCAALALTIALPIATIPFVPVSGPPAEVGAGPANLAAPDASSGTEVVEVAELPPLSLDDAEPLAAAPMAALAWHKKWATALEPGLPYLVCGWLLGVFGLSAWYLGGWAQLQRLRRRMVCEVAPGLQAKLCVLAERLGVRRVVTLLESALVEVPTVVGWLKPVILLPACTLTGLSVEQLEAVLAHELAHIRRYDYLVNMLQTIVEILGFYHPAVWWVSHRIRVERENCCDDVAVHVCGDSVRYARVLAHLEEMRCGRAEWAVAATGGSLIARIGRLLGRPAVNERRFAWLPGLVALLLVASVIVPAAVVWAVPETPAPAPTAAQVGQAQTQDPIGEEQDDRETAAVVKLDVLAAELLCDAKLDRETAIQIRSLLAQMYAQTDAPAAEPRALPSFEELQGPVCDTLLTYMVEPEPAGDEIQTVMDLLISRGYAEVLARPTMEMPDGQRAQIRSKSAPDTTDSTETPRPEFQLGARAKVRPERNAMLLTVELTLRRTGPAGADGSPGEAQVTTITTQVMIQNGRYVLIPDHAGETYTDAEGNRRMLFLMIGATITRPAAQVLGTADPQQTEPVELSEMQARTLLQKMIEANRYWLIGPGPEVKNYSYDFNLHIWAPENEPIEARPIAVPDPSNAGTTQQQGIYYRSILHELAEDSANVRIESVVREGELVRMDLAFTEQVTIGCGNGISDRRGHGIFTCRNIRAARLWLDAQELVPVRVDTEDAAMQARRQEHFSEFVQVGDHQHVPLQIHVFRIRPQQERVTFPTHLHHDLKFSFFEPGLWLFDQSRYAASRADTPLLDEPLVASTGNIVINDVPRAKTDTKARSSKTAIRSGLDELARQGHSGYRLLLLARTLRSYARTHNGRYPESLAALWDDVGDALPGLTTWINGNIAYLGRGQRVAAPDNTPIAYDKILLAEQGGTNVLFNDTHIAFATREELEQGGILADVESPESPPPTLVKKSGQPGPASNGQSHIQIDLLAAEVFSDESLDYETAALVRDLLAEALTAASDTAGLPASIPTVEELQLPLRDIIRDYVVALKLAGDEVKALVDLLVPRGYAKVIVRPVIVAMEGEELEIAIADAPETEEPMTKFNLHATVTPHIGEQRGTIRMETKWQFRHPVTIRDRSGAFPQPWGPARIDDRLITANAEYTGLYKLWERQDEQGRMRLPLILLKPTIMPADESKPPQEAMGGRKPPRPAQVRVKTEDNDAPSQEKAQVLIAFTMAKVPSDKRLDRETALALAGILDAPIQLDDDTGHSQATLGEILAEYVAKQALSDDTVQALVHLLDSRDCMEIVASPQVLTRDGQEARVNIVTEEYYMLTPLDSHQNAVLPEPELEKIETGTKLAVTPQIQGDNDRVRLELGLELCDALPRASGSDLPIVTRRAVKTTYTARAGEYFVGLPIETGDKKALYVMVKAIIVKPAAAENARPSEGAGAAHREFVNSDLLVQELAKSIAETERDLIVARQKLASQDPEVVQKQNLLDALNERLEERRKELQQLRSTKTSDAHRASESITLSIEGKPLREALQMLSEAAAIPIVVDADADEIAYATIKDVPFETALEILLAGTPYVVKKTPEYYLVTARRHLVTAPRHILLDFMVAEVSADERLSPEAARQVSALLSATDGERSASVAARPEALEQCSVGHLLQSLNDKVSDQRFERLLDVLKSHEYMKPLSAPHMAVAEGKPAEINVSDLLKLGVVAEIMKDTNRVQMDISLDLKLIKELPLPKGHSDELQAPPTSVQALQTQAVLAAADRRYAVLELGGVRETAGENTEHNAFYLFVKPEIVRPQPNGG